MLGENHRHFKLNFRGRKGTNIENLLLQPDSSESLDEIFKNCVSNPAQKPRKVLFPNPKNMVNDLLSLTLIYLRFDAKMTLSTHIYASPS